MATPFESAQLNLKLFELRREPTLREARQWFLLEFNPENFDELVSIVRGPRNASFRMVLGYWDMAASLVTSGAIDGDSFRAANGEIVGTFSKIQPFLGELRAAVSEPDFCKAHRSSRSCRTRRRSGPSSPSRGTSDIEEIHRTRFR